MELWQWVDRFRGQRARSARELGQLLEIKDALDEEDFDEVVFLAGEAFGSGVRPPPWPPSVRGAAGQSGERGPPAKGLAAAGPGPHRRCNDRQGPDQGMARKDKTQVIGERSKVALRRRKVRIEVFVGPDAGASAIGEARVCQVGTQQGTTLRLTDEAVSRILAARRAGP